MHICLRKVSLCTCGLFCLGIFQFAMLIIFILIFSLYSTWTRRSDSVVAPKQTLPASYTAIFHSAAICTEHILSRRKHLRACAYARTFINTWLYAWLSLVANTCCEGNSSTIAPSTNASLLIQVHPHSSCCIFIVWMPDIYFSLKGVYCDTHVDGLDGPDAYRGITHHTSAKIDPTHPKVRVSAFLIMRCVVCVCFYVHAFACV